MLWYKAWLETRLRFLVALGLLIVAAAGTVAGYPSARELTPLAQNLESMSTEMAQQIRESLALQGSYRGYIWVRWYDDNLPLLGTLFAIVLGSGNVITAAGGRGNLFTLALPVSRDRLLGVRAGLGLAQWFGVVLISSLTIPVLSPMVGEEYGLVETIVHSVHMFIVGAVFLSLAVLLSTIFSDVWRPLLITAAAVVLWRSCEYVLRDLLPWSLAGLMTGKDYFATGSLPWTDLSLGIGVSGLLLYLASRLFARRDF